MISIDEFDNDAFEAREGAVIQERRANEEMYGRLTRTFAHLSRELDEIVNCADEPREYSVKVS